MVLALVIFTRSGKQTVAALGDVVAMRTSGDDFLDTRSRLREPVTLPSPQQAGYLCALVR